MPLRHLNSSSKILYQIYGLRFITMSLILCMMILATNFLEIKLPLIPLSFVLLGLAITNFWTARINESGVEVSDRIIFIQLLIDILSFSLVLYFSGGATSPFTFFYLIPLAVAATVIPGLNTWILTGITALLYSVILGYYIPLEYPNDIHAGMNHADMNHDGKFNQHVVGMWVGFMVSAVLVTWFITYLSKELKQRNQAIADAHQRELRDQQMITLGTLAAGTAHELGTPLASLAIVAGEITEGLTEDDHPDLFNNQRILRDQIQRCKKILSVLSASSGESRAENGYAMTVTDFINKIIQQWDQQRKGEGGDLSLKLYDPEARVLFDTIISQALINLLNNAAEESPGRINVKVTDNTNEILIAIRDSGKGISDEQIAKAGEVTFSNKPDGLGIGLFLAITTVRRSGGDVNFKRHKKGGTSTLVTLPLL